MNVKTKYYNLLKSGSKTIELRLFDEKRKKIKVGDNIIFANASNSNDTFTAVVKIYTTLEILMSYVALFSLIEQVFLQKKNC